MNHDGNVTLELGGNAEFFGNLSGFAAESSTRFGFFIVFDR
jgi:hypothetical protein